MTKLSNIAFGGVNMQFIFISTTNTIPTTIREIDKNKLKYCHGGGVYRSELRFLSINKKRLLHCFSYSSEVTYKEAYIVNNTAKFFHGYLLSNSGCNGASPTELLPQKNYYGVYSHGFISEENCYFSSDEVGLSPLYYSKKNGFVFVSNNPHLIAIYQVYLGFTLFTEPTLPLWHTIGITIESKHTGYEGIWRVEPWRYLVIDFTNEIIFPSKERLIISDVYEEALDSCIADYRAAMKYIRSSFRTLKSDLTGGFDSRLVLALILDAGFGREFCFTTFGYETNPDVMVARKLANFANLQHNVSRSDTYQDISIDSFDCLVKKCCIANAMESSLVRFQQTSTSIPSLNGFGAGFSKSLGSANTFEVYMKRKFKNEDVVFNNLTELQRAYAHKCWGYRESQRPLLTEEALEICETNRKLIFEFGYSRFPENMVYADSLETYRWRKHSANLSNLENNLVLLYSPTVVEISRTLSGQSRKFGKHFIDIMYRLNQELLLIPFENRVIDPSVYENYPQPVKNRISQISMMSGDITSEKQKSAFDRLIPALQKNLVDILPKGVFDYINRDSLIQNLQGENTFCPATFPLMNLYAIAKWREIIAEMNSLAGDKIANIATSHSNSNSNRDELKLTKCKNHTELQKLQDDKEELNHLNEEMQHKLKKIDKELQFIERQYRDLSKSKLGKIQVAIWKSRSKKIKYDRFKSPRKS